MGGRGVHEQTARFGSCWHFPILLAFLLPVGATTAKKQPPFPDKVANARWLAHTLDWGVLSTTSNRPGRVGKPFGNPYSFSDGTTDNSTGVPYFLASTYDQSMHDIFNIDDSDGNGAAHPDVSLTLSEAELKGHNARTCVTARRGDPENPPCTRLVLSGKYVNLTGTAEEATAKEAFLSRHPLGEEWATFSDFFFGKIDVQDVWLIDTFGGASIIDPAEYFNITVGAEHRG